MTAATASARLFPGENGFANFFLFLLALLAFLVPFQASSQTLPTTTTTPTTSAGQGIIATSDGGFYFVSPGDYLCGKYADSCGSLYWIEGFPDATVNMNFAGGSFPVATGNVPIGIVEGPDGNLYGATADGGTDPACGDWAQGCGVFFKLAPAADDYLGTAFLHLSVVHNFTHAEVGSGGPMILGSDGNYYGYSANEQYPAVLSIYKLSPAGDFTLLNNFLSPYLPLNGFDPSGMIEGDDGNFYGTTLASGGAGGVGVQDGTVFQMLPDGSFKTLQYFPADGSLGWNPGQMVEGPDGAFYGATNGAPPTIFRVTKDGHLSTVYTFGKGDGNGNISNLILGSDGKLYGVSSTGGDPTHCNAPYNYGGCGTLFSVTTSGAFQVLYDFTGGATGAFPNSLIQDASGNIRGTAGSDGKTGSPGGVVFTATFPTGTEVGPIQINLFKQSDMTPVIKSTPLDPNTPLVLKWNVSNAFSNTMRQCFAFFDGIEFAGQVGVHSQPDWTGKQVGTATDTGYSGQTVVTPSFAGNFSYSLTCGGVESGVSPYLTVQNTLSITTSSLPAGNVGQKYSATLKAEGGSTPYTWALKTGPMPPGLSYNASTGTISGKPKQFGDFTLTFTATDASTPPEKANVTLSLKIQSSLAAATPSLDKGVVGVKYSQALKGTGGLAPYKWALISGKLPTGLTFDASTATISGTPESTATAQLSFALSDSESTAAKVNVAYTLTVVPPPLAITTTSVAAGEVEKTYSQQLTAVNGTPPYLWSITAGRLPKGLAFNNQTGFISGKPAQFVNKTTISFKVVDAGKPQGDATASFEITIASGLSITTASVPDATVAKDYSATLAGTGGLKPYKWTIASGALPNGITLDKATGELSGSTAGAGVFKFGVQLEDSEGTPATTTADYKLTVAEPPPSPTTTKLTSSSPSVKVGANVTFTATISKAGGVPTGTVTFRHGGQTLGTGKLNSKGVATLTTSFTAAGVFHFTAIYNGDPTSASSISNQITQTVTAQ